MADDSLAVDAVDAMVAGLETIAELQGRTFYVLGEEELLSRSKVLAMPAAGVIYEGMRAAGEMQGPTKAAGTSVELALTVVLFTHGSKQIGRKVTEESRTDALFLLDRIRQIFRSTPGPNNLPWKFNMEVQAAEKDGVTMWFQRWTLPGMLPRNG